MCGGAAVCHIMMLSAHPDAVRSPCPDTAIQLRWLFWAPIVSAIVAGVWQRGRHSPLATFR